MEKVILSKKMLREQISIFDFTDYGDYLNAYVRAEGRYSHGPYNLKNWAKRLGYRSPSSLTMVLNKQRLPTWRMVHSFCDDFNLGRNARKYFELLVELERKKQKNEDIEEVMREARKLSHLKEYQKVDFDQFVVISDWHCYVIKRLVSCRDFQSDAEWIYRRLRRKVSKAKINEAIDNLLRVGLICRKKNGQLADAKLNTKVGNTIPSAAIRNHHKGMIERSVEAIDEQAVSERIFQGVTLCFDKESDKEKAFADIKNFIDEFNFKYSKDGEGDAVYQLNMQFFEHTSHGTN